MNDGGSDRNQPTSGHGGTVRQGRERADKHAAAVMTEPESWARVSRKLLIHDGEKCQGGQEEDRDAETADLSVKSNWKKSPRPHLGGGGQRRSEIPQWRPPGDHEELGGGTEGREDGGRKERGIRFAEEDNREMSAPLKSEDSVSVGTSGQI